MKKFLTVFFTFTLYFNLVTQAHAAVGGWTMSNPVAKGASTVYTGIKNITLNGADYVKKGTAIVTPTATGVAKVLARGVAGVALSFAVEQIIGADYSWWIEGNLIKYRIPADPNNVPQCWRNPAVGCFATPDSAAKAYLLYDITLRPSNKSVRSEKIINDIYLTVYLYDKDDVLKGLSTFTYVDNPAYNPDESSEDEVKSLPIETVAQKVISNAESGDTNAQVATTAAAADIVAEAEADQTGVKARPIVQQLESTSTTKPADEAAAEKANEATGEQTKNPDKPDTTDLKLTFPIFCNWAPTVCEAAQTVISFPKTLTNWWETGKEKAEGWAASISESWSEAKEWFTAPPEEPQKIDIPTKDLTEKSFLLNVITVNGAYCPADKSIEWDTPVGHFSKTVSYQNFCDASEWFGYLVLAAAYYMGALIVVRDS